MYAVDLLGITPVTGALPNPDEYRVDSKYVAYILNKEFNYTQKDISIAMGLTTTLVSKSINAVDLSLRMRSPILENNNLEKARVLLMMLGYKKLGIDVRNIIY